MSDVPLVVSQKILQHVQTALETFELNIQAPPEGVKVDRALWGLSVRTKAKIETVRWHAMHLKHLEVQQLNLDPFKIYSCFAFELAKVVRDKETDKLHWWPMATAVGLMSDLLEQAHGIEIDPDLLATIVDMAIHDTADPDHAIGRNGLHLIFSMLEKTLVKNAGKTLPKPPSPPT